MSKKQTLSKITVLICFMCIIGYSRYTTTSNNKFDCLLSMVDTIGYMSYAIYGR